MGTSCDNSIISFSTLTDSPVKELSFTFILKFSSILPSALIKSPASKKTTSPIVTSCEGIVTFCPSLNTFTKGEESAFKLSRDCSALTCCIVPNIAFNVITTNITIALSASAKNNESSPATINIITRKSLNCSKNMTNVFFFFDSCNTFLPYLCNLCCACCCVNPFCELSTLSNTFCNGKR